MVLGIGFESDLDGLDFSEFVSLGGADAELGLLRGALMVSAAVDFFFFGSERGTRTVSLEEGLESGALRVSLADAFLVSLAEGVFPAGALAVSVALPPEFGLEFSGARIVLAAVPVLTCIWPDL